MIETLLKNKISVLNMVYVYLHVYNGTHVLITMQEIESKIKSGQTCMVSTGNLLEQVEAFEVY